jgi:hypothetical protein
MYSRSKTKTHATECGSFWLIFALLPAANVLCGFEVEKKEWQLPLLAGHLNRGGEVGSLHDPVSSSTVGVGDIAGRSSSGSRLLLLLKEKKRL